MGRRIKLMLFDGSLAIGGTERSIFDLARLIDKSRFEVLIYCFSPKDHFALKAEEAGIRVCSAQFNFRLLNFFQCCGDVLRTFRKEGIEILHCFNYPTIYYGVVLGVLAKVPYIVSVVRDEGTWKGRSHRFWDGIVDWYADLIIANSRSAQENYIRDKPPDLAAKVITIYGGIDTLGLDQEGQGPDRPGRTRLAIGVIGRLDDSLKGHSDFIKAARIVAEQRKGITFYAIGDGPDRARLEGLALESGLNGKLLFAGPIADLRQIYNMLDIVVIPSRSESLPHVLLEAMYCKKPIIATSVGDIPLILEDQRTGFLIPKGDPETLAQKLLQLIDRSELIQRFGMNARKRFLRLGLTAERTVRRTEKAYTVLVSSSPKVRAISFRVLVGIATFILFQAFLAAKRWLLPSCLDGCKS
ncbi:MAG: glycosyltransferase [Candidatus Methylomirabilales bacterium]